LTVTYSLIDHFEMSHLRYVLYIVLMYFGTVSTVLYHLLYIYYHFKNSVQLIGRLQKNASQLFHQQNIIFE